MPDPKTKRAARVAATKPSYEELLEQNRQQHQLLGERFELIQMYEGQDQRAELAQRNGQLVQQVAELKKHLEAAQSATREAIDEKNAMRQELFQAHQSIARLEGKLDILQPPTPRNVEVDAQEFRNRLSAWDGTPRRHSMDWLTR